MNSYRKRPVEREYVMLRAVTTGLQHTNKLALVLLAGLFSLGVFGLCLPQQKQLVDLEDDLRERQQVAALVEQERDQLRQEVLWLNADSEYLETVARDRNDLYHPGETVYRVERTAPSRPRSLE